ncbi:hypothetical protein B0T25DRAFT_554524 [Lasiosphaeria hispida]|uniref:Large ribosomal subunit protein bL28m n=1 Tax=Lasiosphaeria hispida TaxID=260671 RepID=A0AAJ0M9F4_9PEZI|nr:hypothetical protein B0T25DRAFT_554524 [Lasiosphaeria hispida]
MPPLSLRAAAPTRAATTTTTTLLATRLFSSSSTHAYKQPRVPNSSIPIPSVTAPAPEIPPYPLGPRPVYHQSNTGLYGTARIRFGNRVSERNEIKTRRTWRPNVHHKRLWSDALGVFVRTRVTTRVLRTIDKCGGLDEYLLGIKPARVAELGPWGWRLRWRIMQSPTLREKLNLERVKLGLDPVPVYVEGAATVEGLVGADQSAAETLMADTTRMLANEEEFALGEETEESFMKEEPAKAKTAKKAKQPKETADVKDTTEA